MSDGHELGLSVVFNVLLLDPDGEARGHVAEAFSATPPFSVVAGTGVVEDALAVARAKPIDVVIVDDTRYEPAERVVARLRETAPYALVAAFRSRGAPNGSRPDVATRKPHVHELLASIVSALGLPIDVRQPRAPEPT